MADSLRATVRDMLRHVLTQIDALDHAQLSSLHSALQAVPSSAFPYDALPVELQERVEQYLSPRDRASVRAAPQRPIPFHIPDWAVFNANQFLRILLHDLVLSRPTDSTAYGYIPVGPFLYQVLIPVHVPRNIAHHLGNRAGQRTVCVGSGRRRALHFSGRVLYRRGTHGGNRTRFSASVCLERTRITKSVCTVPVI